MALLLAGGEDDPNLLALANAATKAGIGLLGLRIPSGERPHFAGINRW